MSKLEYRQEVITPARAQKMLDTVKDNRKISKVTVLAYANDMRNGKWMQNTSSCIAVDTNGVVRDGQHRLQAIVDSGKSIKMTVCYGVSPNALFDCNRPRSCADQMRIIRPDIDPFYRESKVQGTIRVIMDSKTGIRSHAQKCSHVALCAYIDENKNELDDFFTNLINKSEPKISTRVTLTALFFAYRGGVKMSDINSFYEVLCTGIPPENTGKKYNPVLVLRNQLKDFTGVITPNTEAVTRVQIALSKFLNGQGSSKRATRRELDAGLIWFSPL